MNATTTADTVSVKAAEYFGVDKSQVAISDIDKSALSTSFQARLSRGVFDCTIYYGTVDCKQVSGATAAKPATQKAPLAMDAKQAQVRLNALGFNVGTPDGVLGRKSVQQLKNFQKSRGLAITGSLDAATAQALQ